MTLRQRILTTTACLSLLAGFSGLANAQDVTDSFSELGSRVKLGSTVIINDAEGRRVKGKLTNLSASSVSLRAAGHEQTFSADRVRDITEQRRYSRRGAAIGFLTGVGLVFLSEALSNDDACANSSEDICGPGFAAGVAAVTGGLLAGIGAGIGAGITHERLIYRAPNSAPLKSLTLAPFVSKREAGIGVSYRF
jgi:hypothetical protein